MTCQIDNCQKAEELKITRDEILKFHLDKADYYDNFVDQLLLEEKLNSNINNERYLALHKQILGTVPRMNEFDDNKGVPLVIQIKERALWHREAFEWCRLVLERKSSSVTTGELEKTFLKIHKEMQDEG